MKQKLMLSIFLVVLMQGTGFTQSVSFLSGQLPLIVDAGLKHISVAGNIDLVLMQTNEDHVKVSVDKTMTSKLSFSIFEGKLRIAVKEKLPAEQRIVVYAWVSDLEDITLIGNSFATSSDILDIGQIDVFIKDTGRVSLRSRGKIKIHAPEEYKVVQQERYFELYSTE